MVFGLLKSAKDKANAAVAKFAKDPNFLEALAAVGVYVGSADGSFDDKEEAQVVKQIASNETIKTAGFDSRTIQMKIDSMADKLDGGMRSGRAALLKEIRDIAGNAEMAEAVLLLGLDIADNGGIDDKEEAALRKVAQELGIEKFLNEQLAA